jgi:prevent-host-death family protein
MTIMKARTIAASKFKAECLRLMDEVAATRQPLVITKHRKPVARLMPVERPARPEPFLDRLKGKFEIVGDLLAPPSPEEDWEYD